MVRSDLHNTPSHPTTDTVLCKWSRRSGNYPQSGDSLYPVLPDTRYDEVLIGWGFEPYERPTTKKPNDQKLVETTYDPGTDMITITFKEDLLADDFFDGYMADCVWYDDYLWIVGGGMSGQRAKLFKFDVLTCTIVDSSAPVIPVTRWGQGICYYDGHFYACDSQGKIYQVDTTPPYVSSLWLDLEIMYPGLFGGAVSADAIVFALGSIWKLRNPGPANHILIQFDLSGNVIDSFTLSSTASFGPEGMTFDGECFWYADHSRDYVFRAYPNSFGDSAIVLISCDSKAPEVEIISPGGIIDRGSITSINSSVDDLHPYSDECSVFVNYCFGIDTLIAVETTAEWIAPNIDCDSGWIRVAVRDSFCNWGYDTIFFGISQTPITYDVSPGWNLFSYPFRNDTSLTTVFPYAIPPAYYWETRISYYASNSILMPKKGFWILTGADITAVISGDSILTSYSDSVFAGWNLIGAIGHPLPVSCIITEPPGIRIGPIYGWSNTLGQYFEADTLLPGKGYWILCTENGIINLGI